MSSTDVQSWLAAGIAFAILVPLMLGWQALWRWVCRENDKINTEDDDHESPG